MAIGIEISGGIEIDYTDERFFRFISEKLIKKYIKGKVLTEFSKEIGYSYGTIYSWLGGKVPKKNVRKFFITEALALIEKKLEVEYSIIPGSINTFDDWSVVIYEKINDNFSIN